MRSRKGVAGGEKGAPRFKNKPCRGLQPAAVRPNIQRTLLEWAFTVHGLDTRDCQIWSVGALSIVSLRCLFVGHVAIVHHAINFLLGESCGGLPHTPISN